MTITSTSSLVRLRSRLENQASSRVRASELRRHRSARGFPSLKASIRSVLRSVLSGLGSLMSYPATWWAQAAVRLALNTLSETGLR